MSSPAIDMKEPQRLTGALWASSTPSHHGRMSMKTAVGAALLVVKGYGAPEMGDAYAHARELWEQLGSPSEFLRIPFGQSRYHASSGELDLAQRLDEDLLRLSVRILIV